MRPVLHGDVVAAARVLHDLPRAERVRALRQLLCRAKRADAFRDRTGRAHPDWGDGSLMTVALAARPSPEPRLDTAEFCACMAMVFAALVEQLGCNEEIKNNVLNA